MNFADKNKRANKAPYRAQKAEKSTAEICVTKKKKEPAEHDTQNLSHLLRSSSITEF